jgi:homoserine dehydrogenase
MASDSVKLGLYRPGTVGAGIVQLLERNGEAITRKLGRPLALTSVASRSINTKPSPTSGRRGHDPWSRYEDSAIDVVIELLGGIEPARSPSEAMKRGKMSSPLTKPY